MKEETSTGLAVLHGLLGRVIGVGGAARFSALRSWRKGVVSADDWNLLREHVAELSEATTDVDTWWRNIERTKQEGGA